MADSMSAGMRRGLLWSMIGLMVVAARVQAQPAPPLPWYVNRRVVLPLRIPASALNTPQFQSLIEDLEYDVATDTIKGIRADLNGDGAVDYVIQSAPSLCGNGACEYAVFDGATHKSLGSLNGFTLYVLAERARGYPIIVAMRAMGAFESQYTTYRFSGSEYVELSTRDVKNARPDSLSRALDRIAPWRPPSRRGNDG